MADLRLSLIIPVYNSMPYLTELLDSVFSQTMPAAEFEVIAVDDGSTDGSGDELDRFAATHSNLHVIQQENWGWPGQPRNRALNAARGRYVFFADSDDKFDRSAFTVMCDFADAHASDIVLPQMGSINGRWVQSKLYARTRIDADLSSVLTTLGPTKLFRRKFLDKHELRFPEEKVRLEDGIMLSRAYFLAQRVSVVTGADYYQIRSRDDGQNISSRYLDPDEYTWAIAQVSRNIRDYDPDPKRANRIILDLYRRKCLKFYAPDRFVKLKHERAERFIEVHQQFQREFIPVELEAALEEPFRSRSEWVRAGDIEAIRVGSQIAAVELAPTLVRWKLTSRGAELQIRSRVFSGGAVDESHVLQVSKRGSNWRYTLPAVRLARGADKESNTTTAEFRLGWRRLLVPSERVVDLHLIRRVGYDDDPRKDLVQRARVAAAPEVESSLVARGNVHPYCTAQGNISIKLTTGRLGDVLAWARKIKNTVRR
ncbi:glycosyltransferase family 2 protein [Brevibacterium luteolum]|uniref:glycosyltransferase family 2 protein n=1 Tax=Brevibacterium luteolum TaxID=199591 RepID=UPI003EEF2764